MKGIQTLDIDMTTGNALVTVFDGGKKNTLLRIDSGCSFVLDEIEVPMDEPPVAMLIEQNANGILPFLIESQEVEASKEQQLPFSINGARTSDRFDKDAFFADKTEIEGISKDLIIETDENKITVLVWGSEKHGIKEVKIGTVPTLPHEKFKKAKNAIRLPMFSWKSKKVKTNDLLIIGRENGQIDQYVLNINSSKPISRSTEETGKKEPLIKRGTLLGEYTPLLNNKITSISTNKKSQRIFITSARGIMSVEAESLLPLEFSYICHDLISQTQEPQGILWGMSQKDGGVYRIKEKEFERESTSSSSSTHLMTTSSSSSSSTHLMTTSSSSSSSTHLMTTSSSSSISESSQSSQSSKSSESSESSSSSTHLMTTSSSSSSTENSPDNVQYNMEEGLFGAYNMIWDTPTQYGSHGFLNDSSLPNSQKSDMIRKTGLTKDALGPSDFAANINGECESFNIRQKIIGDEIYISFWFIPTPEDPLSPNGTCYLLKLKSWIIGNGSRFSTFEATFEASSKIFSFIHKKDNQDPYEKRIDSTPLEEKWNHILLSISNTLNGIEVFINGESIGTQEISHHFLSSQNLITRMFIGSNESERCNFSFDSLYLWKNPYWDKLEIEDISKTLYNKGYGLFRHSNENWYFWTGAWPRLNFATNWTSNNNNPYSLKTKLESGQEGPFENIENLFNSRSAPFVFQDFSSAKIILDFGALPFSSSHRARADRRFETKRRITKYEISAKGGTSPKGWNFSESAFIDENIRGKAISGSSDGQYIYFETRNGIAVSKDFGRTWQESMLINKIESPDTFPEIIHCSEGGASCALAGVVQIHSSLVGEPRGGSYAAIWRTNNYGESWSRTIIDPAYGTDLPTNSRIRFLGSLNTIVLHYPPFTPNEKYPYKTWSQGGYHQSPMAAWIVEHVSFPWGVSAHENFTVRYTPLCCKNGYLFINKTVNITMHDREWPNDVSFDATIPSLWKGGSNPAQASQWELGGDLNEVIVSIDTSEDQSVILCQNESGRLFLSKNSGNSFSTISMGGGGWLANAERHCIKLNGSGTFGHFINGTDLWMVNLSTFSATVQPLGWFGSEFTSLYLLDTPSGERFARPRHKAPIKINNSPPFVEKNITDFIIDEREDIFFGNELETKEFDIEDEKIEGARYYKLSISESNSETPPYEGETDLEIHKFLLYDDISPKKDD